MPNMAREVQSSPCPHKATAGAAQLRPRLLPQPGARKGNNTLQTSATRSLPTPTVPKKQGSPPSSNPPCPQGWQEGDARAGSSQEQGRRQLKKVLP